MQLTLGRQIFRVYIYCKKGFFGWDMLAAANWEDEICRVIYILDESPIQTALALFSGRKTPLHYRLEWSVVKMDFRNDSTYLYPIPLGLPEFLSFSLSTKGRVAHPVAPKYVSAAAMH